VAAPGWTRRVTPATDLGQLLASSAHLEPAEDAVQAATRYSGADLRMAEEQRDIAQRARLADLRHRFIDGPVLKLPGTRTASFVTSGMTPLAGAGTIVPGYRTTAEWRSLSADLVLVAADRSALTVPAPARVEGTTLTGDTAGRSPSRPDGSCVRRADPAISSS